jgi:hypothetical protein
MQDIVSLLPLMKKDSKVKSKQRGTMLNELVELRSCSSSLFFEVLHFPSVAFVCDSVKQPSFTCLSCYTDNSQWYKDKLKLYIGSLFLLR